MSDEGGRHPLRKNTGNSLPEELDASPPYRPVASSSNLHEQLLPATVDSYPPSPAYRSKSNLSLGMLDKEDGEKQRVRIQSAPQVATVPSYDTATLDSRPPSVAGTDDEYDDNDYDWSGDEDLGDEETKFEERMGIKQKRKGWGFKRIATLLFSSLLGSTFLAGVLVTPAILIHFYWYLNNPNDHRLYVKQNVQAWLFWAAANLVISWYLAMIVDVIPTVARWTIAVAWGHVSEVIKTRIELYSSVKNSIKPLLYAASGWASWVIIFANIFQLYDSSDPDQSRAGYTRRLFQIIEFLFFFALVICIQWMLSHAIAFAFHRTAYKDRLDEVREALRVIEKLRDYKPKHSPRAPRSGTRTPFGGVFNFGTPFTEKEHFNFVSGALKSHASSQHDSDADIEDGDRTVVGTGSRKGTLSTLYTRKGKEKDTKRFSWLRGERRSSASPDHEMGVLQSSPALASPSSRPVSALMSPSGVPLNPEGHQYPPPGTGTSTPTSTDGHGTFAVQAAKALKNAVLHDARNIRRKDDSELLNSVGSVAEAKHLARSIYMKFRDRHSHRTYLLPSDFNPAFPTSEEAQIAFNIFDKDKNGDISRAEIKTTLIKVYKERRFLARSMRDVSVALRTLDQILLFFALVILFFISLSVFGVNVGDSLTSVYTLGIAASFIFKNAASNAFDAIMFLFVTHPYDTGDRCFIDDEVLVVKKMGLFATVFARADGTETYYFNSQLFLKFITNVRRSDKTFESLTMQVAWKTPLTKLDALEKCINEWLATEENRWYQPSTSITLQNISYQKYLEITIGIPHNGNWQDWGLRNARKTAFHAATQYYCRQLGIVGYEASLPIVYADADTQEPSIRSEEPLTAAVDQNGAPYTSNLDVPLTSEMGDASEQMKPTLGFLPPPAVRSAHIRARKSKLSKKAMLRGVDGGS